MGPLGLLGLADKETLRGLATMRICPDTGSSLLGAPGRTGETGGKLSAENVPFARRSRDIPVTPQPEPLWSRTAVRGH